MSDRTRLALGLAGGYLLGRYRRTRWLAALVAVAAARKLGESVVKKGGQALGAAPELQKLAGAGREAAVAVLSGRINGLTQRIHERTEALRAPSGDGAAAPSDAGSQAKDQPSGEAGDQPSGEAGDESDRPSGETGDGSSARADNGSAPAGNGAAQPAHRAESTPSGQHPDRGRGNGRARANDRGRRPQISGRPGTRRG